MGKRTSKSIKPRTKQASNYLGGHQDTSPTTFSRPKWSVESSTRKSCSRLYDDICDTRDIYLRKLQDYFDKDPQECLEHLITTDQTITLRIHDKEQWKTIRDWSAKNRQVVRNTVILYEEDMRNKEWSHTGEPIIFGWDGTRLAGMHRSIAGYNAEADIVSDFRFGINPASLGDNDKVKPKNNVDSFYMNDYTNYSHISIRI